MTSSLFNPWHDFFKNLFGLDSSGGRKRLKQKDFQQQARKTFLKNESCFNK
jgi:hypothetical protein